MLIFYKTVFTEMWITISSSVTLGTLDSDYIEDYYGVDGQLTLLHVDTNARIPVLMAEDTDETPGIPHDVFTGFVPTSSLPNGLYRVEGRVRDLDGNYRILSEVQTPFGTESVTLYEILVSPGIVTVVSPVEVSASAINIVGMSVNIKIPAMEASLNVPSTLIGASAKVATNFEASVVNNQNNLAASMSTSTINASVTNKFPA